MDTDFAAAARLLLEIAGPAEEHIEMSRVGPAKYYTIYRAVTFDECVNHLQGIKTRGTGLRHPEQRTRALAFDSDVMRLYPGWWWMIGAAQQLAAAGYQVLLEPSPAGRGGHLWILFDDLVDARAARHHVCQIAPVLADVGEYWPGPSHVKTWNKVRLPGGKYTSPTVNAWCLLCDPDEQVLARGGLSAARVLLQSQTPASIVPPLTLEQIGDLEQEFLARQHLGQTRAEETSPSSSDEQVQAAQICDKRNPQNAPGSQSVQAPDVQQREKFGSVNRFLWFHYTPAQVAAWYSERHTVDDLLDFNRFGMANAEAIGRPERTPSLGSTRDRQHWADFGSVSRQEDGRPDGGDVLELLARISPAANWNVRLSLGWILSPGCKSS